MRKIIKNAIQCKLCGDIIESTDRHDYVECKCGACAVDGGHDYLRRSFKSKDCYIDLSITEEQEQRSRASQKCGAFAFYIKKRWTCERCGGMYLCCKRRCNAHDNT